MRYPKLVRCAKTPVHVTIAAEEINAFGERETILDGDFLCNWQDKSQVKYTSKDTAVTVSGSAYIDGDIQPAAEEINAFGSGESHRRYGDDIRRTAEHLRRQQVPESGRYGELHKD